MFSFRKPGDDVQEVALTIKTETYLRVTLLVVATIIFFGALHKASHAITLIFTAFFLAVALNSPVYWLSRHLPGKRRNKRTLATTLSFLIVIIFIGGFIALMAPPLVKQTRNFIDAAPNIVKDFRSQNSESGRFIRKYHLEDQLNDLSKQLSERLKHIGGSAFSTVQDIGTSLFSLLTIIVLTFMMLVEGPRWIAFAKRLIPHEHHDMSQRLANDMYRVIKGYVNGQVLLAAVAALLISPMLFILGISYPVGLVVVVFICGLIPMVGHTIGAIIVTSVALFTTNFSSALIILAYYILYQQVENYLIQPRIQANSTNMSPLLVFMSVIVGVSFGGLIGGLVAIPVAGCIRIALLEYLRSSNIIDTPTFKEATTETK